MMETTNASYVDDFEDIEPDANPAEPRAASPPPKPATKATKRRQKPAARIAPAPALAATTQARIPSANAAKMSQLVNVLAERDGEIEQLRHENKTLTMVQRRLERALDKFEGADNDVGAALKRKDEEIRVLREFLRVLKDKHRAALGELKRLTSQLLESSEKVAELERLVADKDLKERAKLDAALERVQAKLAEKEELVARLEKKALLDEKERAREWQQRPSDAATISALQEQVARLTEKLDAKEKQLARTNLAIATATTAERPPRPAPMATSPSHDAAMSPTKSKTALLPPLAVPKRGPKAVTASPARAEAPAKATAVEPSAGVNKLAHLQTKREDEERAAAAAAAAAEVEAEAEAAAEARRRRIAAEEEAELLAAAERRRQRALEEQEAVAAAAARRQQLQKEQEEAMAAAAAAAAAAEERRLELQRQQELEAAKLREIELERVRVEEEARRQREAAQEAAQEAARRQSELEEAARVQRRKQQEEEAAAAAEAARLKKEQLLARMKAIDDAKALTAPAPPAPLPASNVVAATAPAAESAPAWLASAPPVASLAATMTLSGDAAGPRRGSLAFENLHRGLPAEGRRAGSGVSLASGRSVEHTTATTTAVTAVPSAAAMVEPSPLGGRRRAPATTGHGGDVDVLAPAGLPPRHPRTNSLSHPSESTAPGPTLNTKTPLPSIASPAVAVVVTDDESGKPAGAVVSPRAHPNSQFPWAAKSAAEPAGDLSTAATAAASTAATSHATSSDLPTFKRASRVRAGPGGGTLAGMQQPTKRQAPNPTATATAPGNSTVRNDAQGAAARIPDRGQIHDAHDNDNDDGIEEIDL